MKEEEKKAPAADPIKGEQESNTFEQHVLGMKSNVYSMAGAFATESIKLIDELAAMLVTKHNQGVQMIEEISRLHKILNKSNIPFEQKNLKK